MNTTKKSGPPCPKCGEPMSPGPIAQSGKRRWWCAASINGERTYCYSTTDATRKLPKNPKPKKFARSLRGAKRLLVTCAQNATPVHAEFLKALETAANHLNAEIVVIPTRYKNPTSQWSESQRNEEYWAEQLQPYLCNERKRVNKNLMIMGDIKTQPTAIDPLTGFDAITHSESGIFGHAKLRFRTVPTPQSRFPKILTTTGVCTQSNFTDSRAGKLGAFHHTLGATLVEVSGEKFHLRQINADKRTGEFIDLDKAYSPKGVSAAPPALGLFLGDTHVDFVDKQVDEATFGKGGLLDLLKCQNVMFNDLVDGYSVNPHHKGNWLKALVKQRYDRSSPKAELERAAQYVVDRLRPWSTSVIVPSNHNDFIMRWLMNTDPRLEPGNLSFWCETALAIQESIVLSDAGAKHEDATTYWLKQMLSGKRVKVLERDESFMLGSVENGMHGDVGPNGARGNIKNLRRIGVKCNIAHNHSPGLDEGAAQAGTSTKLTAEYTRGPGGWLNTHIAQYHNSKRSLITIIDGEFRI